MSTQQIQNRYAQRRCHAHNNNHQQSDKRTVRQSPEQILSHLIQQFNFWCASLRTIPTYEFDTDEENNHRCKMRLPIFPNLQSIGNGAKTKKEAKANAMIALLAHMEKRKQVGLFVPYVIPNLLRNIQVELRRANVSTPDLEINKNEYLLADRIITKRQAEKSISIMRILERICNIRVITLWQSSNMTFVYIVGPKANEELILPYVKALFQPDIEQMFNYGEKLFDVFSDEKFLDNVCLRLKVLCDNHLEKCKLFIRGSSVNVQCCYNEFVVLRREFENEFHRNRKNLFPKQNSSTNQTELRDAIERLELTRIANNDDKILIEEKDHEQLESTRIDNNDDKLPMEEKDVDQLPDYSFYNDDVNASMLRVLRNEEDVQEQTLNQDAIPKTGSNSPILIEVSDDSSDSIDLQVLQTIQPTVQKKTDQLQATVPVPQPMKLPPQPMKLPPPPIAEFHRIPQPRRQPPIQTTILRHVVLDGQNIARNSNDYNGSFSWSRLSNAINYFKNRGHEHIIAFLPLYLRDYSNKSLSRSEMTRERQIRDFLINSRLIAFTPSRYSNGKRLTNYDDRFILQYAADNDGVVVSNDNFRDLEHEKGFQFVIKNRILPFATINDTFMPATDPLGRNGPHLDVFLSKKICN